MKIDDLRIELERRLDKSKGVKKFSEEVESLIKENKWSKIVFMERTGLDEMTYIRVMGDENLKVRTIIAICVGLELDFETTEHLLKLKGYALSQTDLLHRTYAFLIDKSLCIEDCNELLKAFGFNKKDQLLGTQERIK